MKKTNYFEIIGVLSLSLLLTSTYSISGCVPEMLDAFSEYPRSSVELLVSLPSTAIMFVVALTPFLSRFLSSRKMVIIGLSLIGTMGLIPVFFPTYPVMFVGRALLGLGLGLTNTSAVSLIGERFRGDLRTRLQGIRCSMETLGQSALTLVAGQLLLIRWNYSFLIYGTALLILILYLAFVPTTKPVFSEQEEKEAEDGKPHKFTRKEWIFCLQNLLMGVLVIMSISLNNLRMSSYVIEKNLGASVDGSNILSISVFVGFLGGLVFGILFRKLKDRLLPVTMLATAAGLCIIVLANSLFLMTVGAAACSFFTTIYISCLFNRLSDHLPKAALTTANSLTLVGCNLGATITPFVLRIIGAVHPASAAPFLTIAGIYTVLAIIILVPQRKVKRSS